MKIPCVLCLVLKWQSQQMLLQYRQKKDASENSFDLSFHPDELPALAPATIVEVAEDKAEPPAKPAEEREAVELVTAAAAEPAEGVAEPADAVAESVSRTDRRGACSDRRCA